MRTGLKAYTPTQQQQQPTFIQMHVRIIPKPVCFTILDSAVCWNDASPLEDHNCCYFAVILNYRSPEALEMRESKRGGVLQAQARRTE